jgi:tetratricopeptide (TPR) repeat protein
VRYLITVTSLFIAMSGLSQEIDWDYFGQAVEYQKQDKFHEAITIYSELLEVDSNIYGCWKNRGQCFYSLSEYNYALYDLYQAINLNQSDSSLFFSIGLSHLSLEQWTKGIEFFNNAVERGYPKNETFYHNVGSSFYFLGETDSAITYLSKSFDLNPTNGSTLTNLAFSYINKAPSKSCHLFQQAYSLDTLNSRTINNLGYSHYLCGNVEIAYSNYKKALSLDSTNSYLHRNIGLYFKAVENKDLACVSLQKAINLGFINEWGESNIKELIDYCKK